LAVYKINHSFEFTTPIRFALRSRYYWQIYFK